jgi:uncharacterized protein YjiS (DUF1127 family)
MDQIKYICWIDQSKTALRDSSKSPTTSDKLLTTQENFSLAMAKEHAMSQDFSSTIHLAQQHGATGILARLWDNWQARRAVRALLERDDHLLRDMGVTRADVAWAAQLPLLTNAVQALDLRHQPYH